MNWRPDGWDKLNLYKQACYNNPGLNLEMKACSDAFEAGADAMLERIRKQPIILEEDAKRGATTNNWYLSVTCMEKGRWYFIPDEEK